MEITESGKKYGVLGSIVIFGMMSFMVINDLGINLNSIGLLLFLSSLPILILWPYSSKYVADKDKFTWISKYIIKYRNLNISYSEIISCNLKIENKQGYILMKWQERIGKKEIKIYHGNNIRLKKLWETIDGHVKI